MDLRIRFVVDLGIEAITEEEIVDAKETLEMIELMGKKDFKDLLLNAVRTEVKETFSSLNEFYMVEYKGNIKVFDDKNTKLLEMRIKDDLLKKLGD